MAAPTLHLVHKAVNRPMTIFGVERTQVGFVGLVTLVIWIAFHTLLGALVVGVPFFLFSRWAAKRDPHMMQFILESKNRQRRYDPAKHAPVEMGVRR